VKEGESESEGGGRREEEKRGKEVLSCLHQRCSRCPLVE